MRLKFYRQTLWFVQGFFSKYKKIVLFSFLLTILLVIFLALILPKLPQPKKVTYIGIVGKYTASQIPSEIEKELGPGLIASGPRHEPAPGIATSWEISDGGKVYKLFLRQDLSWSNGEKMKLDDLVINIPDVKIDKIEPNTLVFTLPEPFSPFLSILTKPLIKDGVLSLNKYSVKDVKTTNQFLTQVTLDSASQQLIYRFYDSTGQALTAFKLGQIDQLGGLVEKPELANWPNVTSKTQLADDLYVGLFFNNSDPILRDKTIRQALSYGLKDKAFGQKREVSPINPESWAYNVNVKDYTYDAPRARELLTKSLPKDGKLNLEISTTPELLVVANKIKEDWKELGIESDIRVVASKPTTFQVLLYVQQIPDDPDQYIYWHSTQETNFTRYESKKVDKLLEDGRQSTDQATRKQIYWDFQRFLAEDVPVTILYHPTIYEVMRL